MTPRLRNATAADASRVADLLIDTRAKFMPYAPSAHTEDEVRIWVASHLIPTGGVIVAELDQGVVGAMATSVGGVVSWVTQMAVQPSLTGSGIGATLLKYAIRALPAPIRLYTFQENKGARRFYERHGFVAIKFTDGRANEEHCPDVLYEYVPRRTEG